MRGWGDGEMGGQGDAGMGGRGDAGMGRWLNESSRMIRLLQRLWQNAGSYPLMTNPALAETGAPLSQLRR